MRPSRSALTALALLLMTGATASGPAAAADYVRIGGNGSSWAGNALAQWQADLRAEGVTVDYAPDGASSGRRNFAIGLSDFAVSEIPYTGAQVDPQDADQPDFAYAQLPVVAGGTAFMYNLPVGGSRYESLQLSQAALAGIFSGRITTWDAPEIAATNPGVALPARTINVVVRSDGSGSTAQLTHWMLTRFPADWADLCSRTGCDPSRSTSYFPYQGLENFRAQSGSNGVTTYTANTPFAINYDEYSYALGVGFPVARVQNAAGFFVTPSDTAVAVALSRARTHSDPSSPDYLNQDLSRVYGYADPRSYPISAYSYLFVPTETHGRFTSASGATLGRFATYALCSGQQSMGAIGYAPLPMNLVLAGMEQVLRIPGVDQATRDQIAATRDGVRGGEVACDNPTFRPGDTPSRNRLLDTAPFPAGCDAACQAPWRSRRLVTVPATVETPPAFDDEAGGDADADDPAIWVNRRDRAGSRVVATLKNAGLAVYDLSGRLVQSIAAPAAPGPDHEPGRFNNVDIVRGVELDGARVDLAVTSDRGRDQLRTYRIDATGSLSDLTAPTVPFAFSADQSEVDEQATVYGLDAFKGPDGRVYAIGTRRHTTQVGMFRMISTRAGIRWTRVDTLRFPDTFTLPDGSSWSPCGDPGEGPQLEGLVVGAGGRQLYAAQEDVGLWRVPLGVGAFGGPPRSIERTREYGVPATYDEASEECAPSGPDPGFGGRIVADVEGLTLYFREGGGATLLVSSQGDSTFYTYDTRTLAPLVHFRVGGGGGVDGSQDSDGADTVRTPLPGFPNGLLVVQDGENTPGVPDGDGGTRANTDFKFLDAEILTRR